MDGKPPTKRSQVYFFFSEECSLNFFLEKITKNLFIFKCCLPDKINNLMCRSNGKYKNLMEIISNLNVLIMAYNKLKSNPGHIMGMGFDSENTKRY
jgi:hypothetical protein